MKGLALHHTACLRQRGQANAFCPSQTYLPLKTYFSSIISLPTEMLNPRALPVVLHLVHLLQNSCSVLMKKSLNLSTSELLEFTWWYVNTSLAIGEVPNYAHTNTHGYQFSFSCTVIPNWGELRKYACMCSVTWVMSNLFDPMDCSRPGSSIHGLLQARILEWIVIPSSRISSRPRDRTPYFLHLLHWQVGSLPPAPPGKVKVKVTQSCPILCDPMDWTLHRILQARILKWVTFPFSRGSSQPRDQTQVSRIAGRFFTTWATREAQDYWGG